MLGDAILKGMQVYGISIAISMVVAVLIKILVTVTGRVSATKTQAVAPAPAKPIAAAADEGVTEETVAVISAAISAAIGQHRIIHVAESSHSWSNMGRAAQHSHHVAR